MIEGYIQPFFIQQAEKKKEIKERHNLSFLKEFYT
jgi:hypothetical protein